MDLIPMLKRLKEVSNVRQNDLTSRKRKNAAGMYYITRCGEIQWSHSVVEYACVDRNIYGKVMQRGKEEQVRERP